MVKVGCFKHRPEADYKHEGSTDPHMIYKYAIVDDTLNEYLGVNDILDNDVDNFALFTLRSNFILRVEHIKHCGMENITTV
jgi:hypothetical protein